MNTVVEEICFKNSINYFIGVAMQDLEEFYSQKELKVAKENIYKNIEKIYKENKDCEVFEENLSQYIDSVDSALYELERQLQ